MPFSPGFLKSPGYQNAVRRAINKRAIIGNSACIQVATPRGRLDNLDAETLMTCTCIRMEATQAP